ncbi:site-2 protease family protein [Brevibacillus ginsengisoli]|uniref:site-2 protease family protein n=1 Tax=Brevibacillus ginsengisoli TaxID=363854 RepID=UPI003CED0BBB
MNKPKNKSALLAIGAFLAANFKWLIALLKFSKFGTTLISMIVSLGAYAVIYGWKFAVAIVYLIFVHEMGHLVASKKRGIKTSPAVFIPFVGAFISMKEQPRDAATESYIAYGGPFAGLLSFLPAIPLYWWTHNSFWGLLIFLGATINLFNLIPVSPLDGGRIVAVLSTKIWFIGLCILGAYLFFSPNPLLFMIFILGLITWWNRVRESYQHKVLSYEKQELLAFIRDVQSWSSHYSLGDKRAELQFQFLSSPSTKRRFFIPFIDDNKRFEMDKRRIDRQFAQNRWELFSQWERMPVLFMEGNPLDPIPSPLLTETISHSHGRLAQIDEQLHRLRTYYQSPTSTKWKVLVAYLGLMGVLSLCLLYGHEIVR